MAKMPRYLYYLGGGALALLIYTFATAPEVPTTRKANNSFQGAASRKKTDDTYRPEDYTAKFPPVNVVPRDAFKPLVAKTTKTLANEQATPLAPNGIPAAFAGGDGNWVYTGNAEVNGVPNALLENGSSGDSVFLRPGERWKSLTVSRITPNLIEVLGPTGQTYTVRIADETLEAPATATPGTAAPAGIPSGTLPAAVPNGRGALTGPIGADPNSQAAPAGNGGRGRRNRRNNPNNANASAFGTP